MVIVPHFRQTRVDTLRHHLHMHGGADAFGHGNARRHGLYLEEKSTQFTQFTQFTQSAQSTQTQIRAIGEKEEKETTKNIIQQ